jgi:TolB protein
MNLKLLHACATVAWLGCSLMAADVTVVKSGAAKTTLDFSAWRVAGVAAEEARKVVEDDLRRSGWFEIVPSGGAVVVEGECTAGGGLIAASCTVSSALLKKTHLRRSYREETQFARRLAHTIADDIVLAVKNVRGFASSRLVLVGRRNGAKELYICDSDGSGLIQLTHDRSVCLSPSWSPDSKALVYTSFVSGYPDIYRVDLESGQRRRISGFAGLNSGADISPDGRNMALVLSKDGNPELYIMDLRDRRLVRLTNTPYAAEASPSWSGDGRQIAFVSDKSGSPQVYVMDRGGTGAVRITYRGSENVAPDWGGGGRIAFTSRREGRYQICVYDPSSRSETQFTADGADHEDPSWAPDDRHIAYSRTERFHSEIYLLDTGGDPQIRLTGMQGEWYSPEWSR